MLSNDSSKNGLDIAKLRATLEAENYRFDITNAQLSNFLAGQYISFDSHNDCLHAMRDALGLVRDMIKKETTNYASTNDGLVLSAMIRNGGDCNPEGMLSSKLSESMLSGIVKCLNSRTKYVNSGQSSPNGNSVLSDLRNALKQVYPSINWDAIPDDELMLMFNKAQADVSANGSSSIADVYLRMYQLAQARNVAGLHRREAFY